MKFQIIAGDFPKHTEYVQNGSKLKILDKSSVWPKYDELSLVGKIEKLEVITEENKKKIIGAAGWGVTGLLVGGLIAAPVALAAGLAGILKGGNRKEITLVCYLKDGKKFMAVADVRIYQQLVALAL